MRFLFLLAVVVTSFTWPSHAQVPPEVIKAELGKILNGVTRLPKTGAPGPVAIWGSLAFPVLAAADAREGHELAVMAAAAHGKGRIILFGHNSYLEGAAGGDHAKLLENAVKWIGNQQKPRIGLMNVRALNFYQSLGFKTETFKEISNATLKDYDVIILNAQNVTDAAQGGLIAEWVKRGGGLIAGMTGWAFGQTSGGKDLAVDHGLNQALMPAGIAFTDMSAFDQVRAFEARADLPRLINAGEAIQALKNKAAAVHP